MLALDDRQLSRVRLEYRFLATMLRSPAKVPLVIGRLDPKLFDEPVVARVIQAVAETYCACGRVTLDELRSRLSAKDFSDVTHAFAYSSMMTDDAEILAVLDRTEEELAARAAAGPSKSADDVCAPLTKFIVEPREWLWPGRVELGELTLIGGEAGSGKSLVACDLAARTTAGQDWPDGAEATARGSVLLVASSDDVSALMRPRLEAAGADVERVRVLAVDQQGRATSNAQHGPSREQGSEFQRALKAIEQAIARIENCRLVVVDPLRLTIGRAATTVGGDPAARLELLASLARRQRVSMLGVVSAVYEDRRRNSLADALKRATGACTAAAWEVVRHPQSKHLRLFLPAKTTRSSDLEGLSFTVIEEAAGERVHWQRQRVPAESVQMTPRDDTARWLREALAGGRLASKELLELGQRNGYTPNMLHKAKGLAGVTVVREGFGPGAAWHWLLAGASEEQHAKTV